MHQLNFLNYSVAQDDDDKYSAAAKDSFCGGNALSHDPGFFAHLELAIWVATHPGWLNLSIKPWLLFSGEASSCMTGDIAEGPDCVHLHPHYDNGNDGYLSPFYAYQDYGTFIPTLILTI